MKRLPSLSVQVIRDKTSFRLVEPFNMAFAELRLKGNMEESDVTSLSPSTKHPRMPKFTLK